MVDFVELSNKPTNSVRTIEELLMGRQRGRVVRAPDLKSGGRGFKSRSDH